MRKSLWAVKNFSVVTYKTIRAKFDQTLTYFGATSGPPFKVNHARSYAVIPMPVALFFRSRRVFMYEKHKYW